MSTTPPADWYPDPGGSEGQRYWDGTQWTDEVRGAGSGQDGTDVAEAATPSDEASAGAEGDPGTEGSSGAPDPAGLGGETVTLGASGGGFGSSSGEPASWETGSGGSGSSDESASAAGSTATAASASGGPSWAQGGSSVAQGQGSYGGGPQGQAVSGYSGPPAGGPPPLADVGPRFVALLLDGLITGGAILAVVLVFVLLGAVLSSIADALGVLVAIVGVLVYIALTVGVVCYQIFSIAAPYGQTIGMGIAGVRCVSEVDAQPIDRGKAFVRWLVQSFVSGFFLLGYIWALFDDQKRTWHDMVAGTRVVVAEKPGPGAKKLLMGAFKGERQ